LLRFNLSAVFLLLAAFLVQQFMPAFTGLSHSRILIVHLVFLCAAVSVATPTMLLLAFIGGILWDAHCSLAPIIADPEVYTQPAESLRFGYSILLFAGMGFLMQGLSPLFREGKWQFSALLTGIATFLYLVADYALISFVRGEFVMSRSIARLMSYSALLTMLFSPLVFWLLYRLAKLFDHSLYPEADKGKRRSF
jgi:cell shape-determining protein MreD